MSFTEKVIGPDEKLIGISTVHWIYAATGIVWMAAFMIGGTYLDSFALRAQVTYPGNVGLIAIGIMGHAAFWICTILGVLLFTLYFLMMLTSEIALTTKRIIYKRGWIFVKVKEVDIDEIKEANIDNGWLGRIFNYGYLNLDARFVRNINIPAIADPYRFLKALNEMRSNIKDDSMTLVLEGHPDVHVEDERVPRKQPKPRKLEDKRYEAISNNPADEMQAISDETAEAIHHHSGEAQRQMDAKPSPPPAAAQQRQEPKKETAPGEKAEEAPHFMDFRKDTHRDELKEHVLDNFADTAKAPKKKPA